MDWDIQIYDEPKGDEIIPALPLGESKVQNERLDVREKHGTMPLSRFTGKLMVVGLTFPFRVYTENALSDCFIYRFHSSPEWTFRMICMYLCIIDGKSIKIFWLSSQIFNDVESFWGGVSSWAIYYLSK